VQWDSWGDATARNGLWLRNELLRRLRDWQERGIWQPLHFVLLDRLAGYGQIIDWSRAVMDGSSIRAVFGGA